MKIALDFDKTYDTELMSIWDDFIANCREFGHDVRIVTARHPTIDNIDDHIWDYPVIYCDGVAKRKVCESLGWVPDVWIDDKPHGVDQDNLWSEEAKAEWRRTREY